MGRIFFHLTILKTLAMPQKNTIKASLPSYRNPGFHDGKEALIAFFSGTARVFNNFFEVF